MDYDDNDFQSQNLRLAGEGSAKFPPVLGPYALPKFDFDDSLQGHLRFDSLVETEVFLGIESQEDNHWIEDFSRGSSGIEFSSSAAESCSISRRNNVWSEATSSESVEMLLKSVGQEEIVPGQTIVKDSGACDELGNLTEQMEHNLKPDNSDPSNVGNVIDSGHTIRPDEFLGSFSVLHEDAGKELPQIEDTSQIHEGDSLAYGSSNDLPVTEKDMLIGSKDNDKNQREIDTLINESLNDSTQDDCSASGMQVDNIISSMDDIITSAEELNNQKDPPDHMNDVGHRSADGLSKDNDVDVEEHNVFSKEEQMDDKVLHGNLVDSGAGNLEHPLYLESESRGEGKAVETCTSSVEQPSMMLKGDSELKIVEGCCEGVNEPVRDSKCEVVVLSKDTEMVDQLTGSMHGGSPIALTDDSNFPGHAGEASNKDEGNCAILEMNSHLQMTCGKINDDLLESGNQLNSEMSTSHLESSLLSKETSKLSEVNFDGSGSHHEGDISGKLVVSSSAELLGESHTTENAKCGDDALGVHGEDMNAGDNVPISTPSESTQIHIQNVVSMHSGIHNFGSDAPVVEEGNVKLSTDLSNIEHETGGSSPVGEFSRENEVVVPGPQSDAASINEPAPDVVFRDTDLASHETLDGSSLPSGLGVSSADALVHKEDGKPPLLAVAITHLDGKEEVADGTSVDVSSSAGMEHSQVGSKMVSTSDEKDAHCDTAGEKPAEEITPSLSMMKISNAVRQNEPQAMIIDKDNQESEKLEVCSVLCDSTAKEGDGVEPAFVKVSEEASTKESFDEASLKVTDVEISRKGHALTPSAPSHLDASCSDIGQNFQKENGATLMSGDKCPQTAVPSAGSDALNGHEVAFSAASVSEHDAKLHVTDGGRNNADSDKPSCGSPTVISCIDLSESEKESQQAMRSSAGQNVAVTDVIDGNAMKGSSMSQDPKEDDSSKDERSFTFEVGALADLPEREAGKCWQPFSSTQACKTSAIVEGFPSTSVLGPIDPKMPQEISRGSPRASDGAIVSGSTKGTHERKPRRSSSKATGKETAKKGSFVKDTTHARQPERVDKSSNMSPSPSGSTQFVQPKEMQHCGHVERGSTKSCGPLTTPTSNLPDLNTSASPSAMFQQPFTDLQQVQLRAQIFVYGSLIQGTAPDEACMASAFGPPDGGRSLWENAWRASVERLQGQKSHPSNPETPLQSRSGSRTPDQASIQQSALQGKVIPSPVGRASSKGTPSTIVNTVMPLPSPLWSITTPGDVMQSSGLPRGGLMDHHQALSPLHPYQTPPVRNFVGHNTSWISQPTFTGPWVPSQTSGLDGSIRFPAVPATETVKLTPVRESTLSHSSSVKHVSSGPVGHSGAPTSVFAGTPLLDAKKTTPSPGQPTTDPKPRKRKKTPASEGPGQISLPSQSQTESIPVVTSHFSTSVSITTPASLVSKSNTGKLIAAASPTFSSNQMKLGSQDAEQRGMLTEETLGKVKEAELQAEDAAALAAAAVRHSQGIWSELNKQKNSGLISDVEAKIASAAVAIAAAASVAKAAAAAAKVASNAALQAKLMAEEALVSSANIHSGQIPAGVSILGKATPASILKGVDGTNCSSSIIFAAREAARRRVEAASAASKRAENLDAIVKAAELAAEAVSQAGKIVAMGDSLPLSELVEAGPESYLKASLVLPEPVVRLNMNSEQADKNVEEGPGKLPKGALSDKKETHIANPGKPLTRRDMSREVVDDHPRLADGMSSSVTSSEKDSRGQKGRKVSDLAKTIGVVPESEVGSRSNPIAAQNEYDRTTEDLKENSMKEGSLVEVFKDGNGSKAAWFSANVLSLKDQKAYVCYVDLPSEEGSGQLKEWVALESEGDKPPRIRVAHPMTAIQFEGTRKRRRAAIGDYSWSVGDRVDVWVQKCWCEGVVTEKSRKDETMLTVHISAQGETSVVRAWHLRPSLIWKDGEWIEWSSARLNDHSSHEGDTPQEKRLKLSSPAVEAKGKDKMSKNIAVDTEKPEEQGLLTLLGNEKVFNIGKNTRDENKPDGPRMIRTGLQKEGSRVIFGVPKPGKKRKFMEVSKHYVADRSNKISEANDSVKFAKYLIPQGTGPRAWKNSSKIDSKEKRAVESKPKVVRSGKLQNVSSRMVPRKDNLLTSGTSASDDANVTDNLPNIKDSVSHDENASGKQVVIEFESFSNTEGQAEGPILFSSLPLPSDAPSSKKVPVSNAKSQRVSKGKLAPSGGKLAKIEEEKVYNGNPAKPVPEIAEPRRSNRRIQPTSRLLEGLQSSLIISKIPSVSHDKGHKSQNRSVSRGMTP